MSLSSDELTDLRADLAANSSVFSDAELQRLYTRAGSYNGAALLALRQLLANATKFSDFTAGQTSERRSQVFEQLYKMLGEWKEIVAAGNQVRITGLRLVPTPWGETPHGEAPVDDKQRRSGSPLNRRRGAY